MKELLKKLRNGYDIALGMEAADEIETLRKRLAESDKTSDEHLNARYLAERRAEKAEAALTEARARLTAADRMAEAIEVKVSHRTWTKRLDMALQAYRKETGQ